MRLSSARQGDLLRDGRGAMTLAGAFMSIFLTGMVYYLLAVGDSIVLQERLQHAADTEAFGASVTLARSMNVVALVNTVATSLTASLMAGNLLVIAGHVCVARGALPHDDCVGLLARMQAIEARITPPIHRALEASTSAATDVVESTPEVVADDIEERLSVEQGELVHAAFLVPHRMPFADAGTEPLCALGNLYQFRLVEITLGRSLMEDLIGRGFPRVGRRLPQCEDVRGGGAVVADPPDLPVGTEPFQIRVVIVGDTTKILDVMPAVRIAPSVLGVPPSTSSSRDFVEARDPDRMLVMAQAEYFSDWEDANLEHDTEVLSIEAESFRMRWRGRLRRLRVPTGVATDDPARERLRDEWISTVLVPACRGACAGLSDEIVQATDSFH